MVNHRGEVMFLLAWNERKRNGNGKRNRYGTCKARQGRCAALIAATDKDKDTYVDHETRKQKLNERSLSLLK